MTQQAGGYEDCGIRLESGRLRVRRCGVYAGLVLLATQVFRDRLGKFGLAGVVGDVAADPHEQRLVVGPGRSDKPLAQGLRPGGRVGYQTRPD